jgi:hypothetical protein
MPLVGGLVDRMGARLVCAGGGVLLAASLALTARMTSYWEFLLYFGVLSSLGLLLFAAGLSMAVRQGRHGSSRAGARIMPRPAPRPVAGGR